MNRFHVLIVDDEPEIRKEIWEYLVSKGMTVHMAAAPSEAFAVLDKQRVDICLLDLRLPEMNGIDVLARIRKDYPGVEVIMITAHGEMDNVISAMRLGAIDFFNKPFHLKDLDRAIHKTRTFLQFQRKASRDGNHSPLIGEELTRLIGQPIIAESPQMKSLVRMMHNVAPTDGVSVLITGESGVGKELVARGIHFLSPRKKHPFHALNCSSVPEELFESEFFGHTKGAFTGASGDKTGWLETASGSTLFLDEIGDLKLGAQPKLLRFLDEQTLHRIGSTRKIAVDVRVVAATNHDLERLVEERQFRPDLYYRLNTIMIHVPPLRDRREDILPLFYHFLENYSTAIGKPVSAVDPDVIEWIHEYTYPGNIRELKHMVERALILSHNGTLSLSHFIRTGKFQAGPAQDDGSPVAPGLKDIEKQTILQALRKSKNVKMHAARLLNISRQSLDRKIEKYGIKVTWSSR